MSGGHSTGLAKASGRSVYPSEGGSNFVIGLPLVGSPRKPFCSPQPRPLLAQP